MASPRLGLVVEDKLSELSCALIACLFVLANVNVISVYMDLLTSAELTVLLLGITTCCRWGEVTVR